VSEPGAPAEPTAPAPAGDPAAADVAAAGRSCLAIIVIVAAVLLFLCVGLAARWAMAQ
jgi:hypothetical protein